MAETDNLNRQVLLKKIPGEIIMKGGCQEKIECYQTFQDGQ